MFNGYLELNGTALINTEATEAYLAHLMPGAALKPTLNTSSLQIALQDDAYRTPLLDDAPWVNPSETVSGDFFGLYPLSVEGLDDDTTTADTIEYLTEGGSTATQRRGSKPIRVTGFLVARNPLAVQYGRDWLASALRSTGCADCTDGLLRYFVAEPEACVGGAFGPESGTDGRVFGLLNVGTFRYRFPSRVNPQMPARVTWAANWPEGTAVRYGAAALESVDELQHSEVIQPLRRNHVLNATFRTDLAGWTASGPGTLTRQVAGGSDGGAYARVLGPAVTRLGPFGRTPFGQGPFGGTVPPPTVTAAVAAPAVPAGPATLSVALRGVQAVALTVSAGGVALGSTTLTPGPNWQRFGVTVTNPSLQDLVVTVASNAADFDHVLLEAGSYQGDYFDGTSTRDGYSISWEGLQDASISRATYVGTMEIDRDDSQFRPFLQILSGSAANAQVDWVTRAEIGMDEQLLPYERHLFDVSTTSGVKTLREVDAGAQGAYLQVEFDLVAGKPAAYGLPEPIATTPLSNAIYVDPPVIAQTFDTAWLSDPNAVAISLPPKAPVILNPAIESINSWRRYYVPIPASSVADTDVSVATVAITSRALPIGQVRVRFHPNPFGWPPAQVDDTSYCSEFVLSYLPSVTRMEVDGVMERAQASRGDQQTTAADHLLYGSNGGPVTWAELGCAIPYLMTVDVPTSGTIDQFDLELTLRRKH